MCSKNNKNACVSDSIIPLSQTLEAHSQVLHIQHVGQKVDLKTLRVISATTSRSLKFTTTHASREQCVDAIPPRFLGLAHPRPLRCQRLRLCPLNSFPTPWIFREGENSAAPRFDRSPCRPKQPPSPGLKTRLTQTSRTA